MSNYAASLQIRLFLYNTEVQRIFWIFYSFILWIDSFLRVDYILL